MKNSALWHGRILNKVLSRCWAQRTDTAGVCSVHYTQRIMCSNLKLCATPSPVVSCYKLVIKSKPIYVYVVA